MEYEFYFCDVFTDTAFGGNQLAVLPNATGLSDKQMQQIAREFNYSETSFVFPPEKGNTKKVRIFTPVREVPFAGHPNVGTAYVLASIGEFGEFQDSTRITFEEKAGLVGIYIKRIRGNRFNAELKAPEEFSTGKKIPVEKVAKAISLTPEEIIVENHVPQQFSVGLPFVMAELKDQEALSKVKINLDGFQEIADYGIWPSVHMYIKSRDEFDIRTRMFAPLSGVPEDPATGSANCALSALLAHLNKDNSGQYRWKIAQGYEMGRPSILMGRAEKRNGKVTGAWIGGESVMTCKGSIFM